MTSRRVTSKQKVAIAAFAGLACTIAASWLGGTTARQSWTKTARDLLRPLVLPGIWGQIEAASAIGDHVTVAALGRDLLRVMPEWTDGYIHFAARLAFEHGTLATTDAEKLARLEAGLDFLETARAEAGGRDQAIAAALAAAQATFVQARCADPGVAAALRAARGVDPSELAIRYLDAAIAAAPTPAGGTVLRERRAVLLVDVIAAALRTGDLERARTTLDAAIVLLGQLRDPAAAVPWVTALRRFRPLLHGESVDLERLRADPHIEGLIEAYQSR